MAITNFIPTVWSENLYHELDKKYIAVSNCNRDFEGEIKEKGNTVRICGIGDVAVSEYTKNANMNAPAPLSDTARELKIDQAKYFNFQIDDIDRAQASPKLMEAAMKNAASALANEADKHVFYTCSLASNRLSFESTNESNILDCILKARENLYSKNVAVKVFTLLCAKFC